MIATHIHKETGNLYQVLFHTNIEATKDGWIETIVYIDKSGALWSRPKSEFDEKFEEIK